MNATTCIDRFGRRGLVLVWIALLTVHCSPGDVTASDARNDGHADARIDGAADAIAMDAPTPFDTAHDGSAIDAGLDGPAADVPLVVPGCDPVNTFTIRYDPDLPVAPNGMTVHANGADPVTNIVLSLRSTTGTSLTPAWGGVDGSYHWWWTVGTTAPGDYCVTVSADPSSRVYYRGPLRIAGTMPTDGGMPPAGDFVTRSGTEFVVGTSRLRFIGMNTRGLPHFGTALLPYATTAQIDTQLDEVQRMGARVVRVFGAAHDADHATVAARLDHVLSAARTRGIYVIVALTDFYTTGFSPQGDDGAYDDTSWPGGDLLGRNFYAGGFRTNYLPWVRTVVTRHRDNPAVFAWELGNEIKCDADHAAFLSFAHEVGTTIRGIDTNHLIASGMITSAWMSMTEARAFYGDSVIDVITLHEYGGSHAFDESWASREFDKPWIVEEAGFESGDRAAQIDGDIRYWVDGLAGRGYMQWGFTVITPDNGDGDRQFGMDRLFHASDYNALFGTYSSSAMRIR